MRIRIVGRDVHITIVPLQERHFVTLAIFALAVALLLMAREDKALWEVELFKIMLQAVIISGIIGSILSFHFAANKRDDDKVDTSAKAVELATKVVDQAPAEVKAAAVRAADEVKDAAVDAAAKITDDAETARDRITEG